MNINEFATKVAKEEGKKVAVNIAQIKEVLSVTDKLTDGEFYKLIKTTTNQKSFKEYQKIKTKEGHFICIAVNGSYAIFAPRKGSQTQLKNMFCVFPKYVVISGKGNAEGFEFELVK